MSWTEQTGARSPPQFTAREEEFEWLSRTAKEIAQINSDVHGITDGLKTLGLARARTENETTMLSKLEAELSNIPAHRKSTFSEAQRRCPRLVDSNALLPFLWTEEFNAQSAAERLVAYWEQKKKLFGAEKCFLPVTLRGALKDDAIAIFQGLIRIVPAKDKRGRAILFLDPAYYKPELCSTESMLRACWYVLSVASEDPELEIVLLSSGKNFRCFQHFNYDLYKGIVDMERRYLPIRWRCCHHCYPSIFFHLTSPIAKYFLGGRLRARFVCHFGTEEEVMKKLDSFGFPREKVPVELGGDLLLDQRKWLLQRLTVEVKVNDMFGINEAGALDTGNMRGLSPHPSNSDNVAAIKCIKEPTSSSDSLLSPNAAKRLTSTEENKSDSDADSSSKGATQSSKIETAYNKGDPRMNAALVAKLENPDMSLLDALLQGGFEFINLGESGLSAKKIYDCENVSLYQRKNQLNRRIRKEKKRRKIDAPETNAGQMEQEPRAPSGSSEDHATLDLNGQGLPQIFPQPAVSSDLVMQCAGNSFNGDSRSDSIHGSQIKAEAMTSMDLSNGSLASFPVIKDEAPVRRDSFYDMITELPGLGDLQRSMESDDL